MPDENIEQLFYKNYIAMIENSIGTGMFRNFWDEKRIVKHHLTYDDTRKIIAIYSRKIKGR